MNLNVNGTLMQYLLSIQYIHCVTPFLISLFFCIYIGLIVSLSSWNIFQSKGIIWFCRSSVARIRYFRQTNRRTEFALCIDDILPLCVVQPRTVSDSLQYDTDWYLGHQDHSIAYLWQKALCTAWRMDVLTRAGTFYPLNFDSLIHI